MTELFPLAERLERYGIAGFGWGAAWLAAPGRLVTYRDVRAFRDDPGRDAIGSIETTSLLVHLRRPSRLSTLTLADTQPFADPAGRFAFSHNGDLRNYRPATDGLPGSRPDPRPGRHRGRRPLARGRLAADAPVGELLGDLHRTFSGPANLAVLAADGSAYHYAGNEENPVFSFRLGSIEIASTGIYSLDRSLFRYVAPGGRDRQRVELDPDGRPGLRSAWPRFSRPRKARIPTRTLWRAPFGSPAPAGPGRGERGPTAAEGRRPGPRIEPGQGGRTAPQPGHGRPTAGRGSRAGSAAARTRTGPAAG